MKQKILIFLLLLTFNANATSSVILMAGMVSSMEMSMSSEDRQPIHNHSKKQSHEASVNEELSQKTSGICNGDISCSACLTHCTSVMVLIEVPDFGVYSRPSFSEIHTPSEIASNLSRLLRPPKFS